MTEQKIEAPKPIKCTEKDCEYTGIEDNRDFKDPQYEIIFEKKIASKVPRSEIKDLQQKPLKRVTSYTYENLYFKSDFDWVFDRWQLGFVIVFLATNVVCNILLYRQYLVVEDADILRFVSNPDIWFPLLIIIAFVSIFSVYGFFAHVESKMMLRFTKYLATAELASLLGAVSMVFWASIAIWCAFTTYFLINLDLESIRPNKYQQLDAAIDLPETEEKPAKKQKRRKKK